MQKADGYANARSTWPLFDHLRFLDSHIRPRKSYKALGRRPRPVGRPRRNNFYDENDAYVMFNERGATQYANPIALQQQQQQQQQNQQLQQSQNVQIKTEPDLNKSNEMDTSAYRSEYES